MLPLSLIYIFQSIKQTEKEGEQRDALIEHWHFIFKRQPIVLHPVTSAPAVLKINNTDLNFSGFESHLCAINCNNM